MPIHLKPVKPGFYWARWMKATIDTREGEEQTPSPQWEIVHVVENALDQRADDYLMVMVPGQSRLQPLANFAWGVFVDGDRPAELY